MKRLLLALTLVLAPVLLVTPSAWAHSGLDSSTPKDGAKLDAPPTEIVLNFNEQLLENAVKVVAHPKGESGNVLDEVAQAAGKSVTVPWPADLPAGTYELAYRIVSADGHPVTGTLAFSYAAESAPVSASATTTPSTPAPSSSSAAAPSPVETVTASPLAAPTASTTSASPLPLIIIGLVIGIAIGLVIFFVAKKRA